MSKSFSRSAVLKLALVAGTALVLPSAAFAQQAPAAEQAASADEADGNAIVVTGFRKSLEAALNLKKESIGAVDAIVAEDIAKFPDNNLAESMQRIPGIAISRDGGEGKQITVRGLSGQFTTVRVNGMQAEAASYTAGSGGGVNRERVFDFNVFATEMFKSLVVHKTAEANLDEGSLGAVVDLNTGHPLGGQSGLTGAVSAQAYYNDLSKKTSPKLSGALNWKSDDGTVGINASVAWSKNKTLELGNNTTRWAQAPFNSVTIGGVTTNCFTGNATGNYVPGAVCDKATLAFHPRIPRYGNITHDRERLGLTGAFEWQPSDRTHLEIDGLYSRYHEIRTEKWAEVLLRTNEKTINLVNPVYDANNNIVSATLNNAFNRNENYLQDQKDTFWQISGKLEHQLTDKLKVTLSGGTSKADESVPIATTIIIDNLSATGIGNSQGYTYDYTNMKTPVLTFGTGASDPTNPANYQLTNVRDRPNDTVNKFTTAKFDLDWDVAEGFKVRGGAFFRQFDFISVSGVRDTAACSAKLGAAVFGGSPAGATGICAGSAASGYPLTAFPAITTSLVSLGAAGQPAGTSNSFVVANIDSAAAFSGLYSRLADATTDAGNNRSVTEKEKGFYLQFDAKGQIIGLDYALNAGVRYIRTDVRSTAVTLTPAPVTAVPLTANGNYSNWLPSVNVNFFPAQNLIFRMAAASVMTRPSLANLSTTASINQTNLTISFGNPNLLPSVASNYDVGLEWYFAPQSLLSVALFSKNVKAGILTSTLSNQTYASSGLSTALLNTTLPGYVDAVTKGDPGNWSISRTTNSAVTSNIRGLELGLQMPFRFLPGPLTHLGMIANLTLTDSNVNYSVAGAATTVAANATGIVTASTSTVSGPFVNASKTQYNFTLYYEDSRFGARVSYAYRGPYYDSTSGNNGNVFDGFGAIKTVDASVRYTVMKGIDLTLDATNLLDTYIYHFNDVNAQRNFEYYHTGRTLTFGARYKF